MPLASTSKIRIMEYKDQKYTYLGGLIHGISTLATGMKTSIKVYFRKKVTEQYPENRKEPENVRPIPWYTGNAPQ